MGHTRRKHQRLTTAYSLPCFSSLSLSHLRFLFFISFFFYYYYPYPPPAARRKLLILSSSISSSI